MTDITQCPQCGTHFKITQAQRDSHKGMVRCGQCQSIFNAVDNLYTPPEQLALPLEPDDMDSIPSIHSVYDPYNPEEPDSTAKVAATITTPASPRLANDFSHLSDFIVTTSIKPASPRQTLLWALASLLTLLVLLFEAAYYFRVELTAHLPGIKPVMQEICAQLNCTLPLPQKIDLLSIESSELEADPSSDNIITLHALLRSRAPHELAYPNIELTLTDTQDNPVARRSFSPAEYLPGATTVQSGFPPNRESGIKLHLNTTDLKPAGYRLFLFYPQ